MLLTAPAPTRPSRPPQAAAQATADNESSLGALEAGDKEARHRMTWLVEQLPLVEARLDDVRGRTVPPAGSAVADLQALVALIEGKPPPPLEEATATRDAVVDTLLAEVELAQLVRAAGCRGLQGAAGG